MAPAWIAKQLAEIRSEFGEPLINENFALSKTRTVDVWGELQVLTPEQRLSSARHWRARDTWVMAEGFEPNAQLTVSISDHPTTELGLSVISLIGPDDAPQPPDPVVRAAWVVPAVEAGVTPTEAFLRFVEVFGVIIEVGNDVGQFVARSTGPASTLNLAIIGRVAGRTVLDAKSNTYPSAMGTMREFVWAYAIDAGKYLPTIRK